MAAAKKKVAWAMPTLEKLPRGHEKVCPLTRETPLYPMPARAYGSVVPEKETTYLGRAGAIDVWLDEKNQRFVFRQGSADIWSAEVDSLVRSQFSGRHRAEPATHTAVAVRRALKLGKVDLSRFSYKQADLDAALSEG